MRTDNGSDNEILLVVRDDARHSDALYGVSMATYEAYNNYGGKSLYDYNSLGNPTIAGTVRAVKVSFDRPFEQPRSDANTDWYDKTDFPFVYWLEKSGYDVTYISNTDLDQQPSLALGHKLYISPSHDEYVSAGMRTAMTQARDAKVNLFFSGSNADYWKIRFEASPTTGRAGRTLVCYKTTAGGPVDPQGPTGLWRDKAGANQPENALIGQQYTGDDDFSTYPMVVNSTQGKDRVWRYTDLATLAPGDSASLPGVVGWEWDARANNGSEPSGVVTLASSPVSGNIFVSPPYNFAQGSATVTMTKYLASSGALVVSTGTNDWDRALALNADGTGQIQGTVQQATTNILADMGVHPITPASDIVLDSQGAPQVIGFSPADGANGVVRSSPVVATFSRDMTASTITASSFTLVGPGGTTVPATVSYNAATDTVTLTPSSPLAFSTGYTATLTTAIKDGSGQALASAVTWSFVTEAGVPPTVTAQVPAASATGISPSAIVDATFSRPLDPATVKAANFTLAAPNGTLVPATVTYDSNAQIATLSPNSALALSTTYTAKLSTSITAIDGVPLSAAVTWTFTTAAQVPAPPTVAVRSPGSGATGVDRSTTVTATFSRAMDPSTLTATTFTLAAGTQTVQASVSYNTSSNTATLSPNAPLVLSTTYTATIAGTARAADGTALGSAASWSFRTADPLPPPTVTGRTPADSSTGISRATSVSAAFSRALDPSTVSASSFTLTAAGSPTPVDATVTYNATTFTATLAPSQLLAPQTSYTARVAQSVAGSDGVTLTAPATWQFTTGPCPCNLFSSTLVPAAQGQATDDGRTGAGPWTRELGVKIGVDKPMELDTIRFYKSPGETGTHIGRIWDASGIQLAQTTFVGETSVGWQEQALASPLILYPGKTYVVSINANAYYVATQNGLATQVSNGPVHTIADGANGVYGAAAGNFPQSTYHSTNYFVDVGVVDTALPPPLVTQKSPANGTTGVSVYTNVQAVFSRSMDPASITSSSFTLKDASGSTVPATVTYDDATLTATLTPNAGLLTSSPYTVTLASSIQSADVTPLAAPVSWSFTTAAQPPSAPTVTSTSPAAGSTYVARSTTVRATFSKSMRASTLTGASFTLTSAGGQVVNGAVSYDDSTHTATLTPAQPLDPAAVYTAGLATSIRAADGAFLASTSTWRFTTAACPCSLFAAPDAPASVRNPTDDGRSGPGPWTYELGVKVTVTQPMDLTAISFFKSPGETGTHVGRVWTTGGLQVTQVTFAGETASGWQIQTLPTPIQMQPGATYVISVNANAYYVATPQGLATQRSSGPLRSVADGANGVYGSTAGTFPNRSYNSSNYFVDLQVVPHGDPGPLGVTSVTPASGSTNVPRGSTVTATFSRNAAPQSVTSSTFTLQAPDGSTVPAGVTYDDSTQKATLTPSSLLAYGTTYTALINGVAALDGEPLANPVTWSFTAAPNPTTPFTVASTTPASGSTNVPTDSAVTATFNRAADPQTLSSGTFVLRDGGGNAVPATVSYNSSTLTATLSPTSALTPQTTYSAQLTAGVKGEDGTALAATVWSFTTGACPCSLFAASLTPASTGNPVDDGRSGSGPFSYELGVKVAVTSPVQLTAIRFYKDSHETGVHVGTVWSSTGSILAQVTFANESASGWQQQALPQSLQLQPGTVYVVSVGLKAYFDLTTSGLANQIVNGPLQSVADGANGVFASAAGLFPTSSYKSSNYFVDVVVK